MKFFIIGLVLYSFTVGAHGRRHHDVHVHGAGKLGIAFEGANGKIDLKIPSESILGFEHEAKTKRQKAAKAAAISALEQKADFLVVFDPALQCIITPDKVEVIRGERSTHSDTVATYSVKCAKSPVGSVITFNIHNEFPKIKSLGVEVVADNIQKAAEVKASGTRLELK